MNLFSCANFSVIQIIVILISISIDNTVGQQFKTVQTWPPKEDFTDSDNDNIRGTGGKDYPIYNSIPKTSFTCSGQIPGLHSFALIFHSLNSLDFYYR